MEPIKLGSGQKAYLEKIEEQYSYEITKKLETYQTNPVLGYRTAGSEAEFLTGDMLLNEMEKIGLKDVHKDAFTLDTWTFEKAKLYFTDRLGREHSYELGGYQTQFDTNGRKEFEVVYCSKGRDIDYLGLDVEGKLVLIDINQRDEWWINYPAMEAHIHKAAAVLAVQSEGFGEIDPDALNAQDICGPDYAPVFSISQNDANRLKLAISQTKVLKVEFEAKSTIGFNGTSYNIIGSIPGKNPDSLILLSAHYDSYFTGFQDDNAAIGQMLGIAKGLIESGYKPEKTILFCAMAAEEWGISNSKYDWSVGAYNQVFRIHPEWVGKTIANINFELPAYTHDTAAQIRGTYELVPFLNEFKKIVPPVEGAFPDGIEVIYPVQTWADDFSMSIAGIPALRNDFASSFLDEYYHTQFDNEDTYDEKSFRFHHNLYGLLVMEFDNTIVAPLDFTVRLESMKESILKESGHSKLFWDEDVRKNLLNALDMAIISAKDAALKVVDINQNHRDLPCDKIKYADELNKKVLDAYKFVEDSFVRLNWDDMSCFPHNIPLENGNYLCLAIEALEENNLQSAKNALEMVDNNCYAFAFSREVYDYFTDYVLNQPLERLQWGAGRILGHQNLYDIIRIIMSKEGTAKPDFTQEIAGLKIALQDQRNLLKQVSIRETTDLLQLYNNLACLV